MRYFRLLWRLLFPFLARVFVLPAGFVLIFFSLWQGHALAANYGFTLDFEEGTLAGWSAAGQAFSYQPTKGDNPSARSRGQPSGHKGRYWVGTFEKFQGLRNQKAGDVQGDRPTGTLTSPVFVIPRGSLSFLVGGGSSYATRVELLVIDPIEGQIRVEHASGANTETMRRETWQLGEFSGKKGRIRIVDDSSGPWGHINVDDFRFSDSSGTTVTSLPERPPTRQQLVPVPDLSRRPLVEAERMVHAARLELAEGGTIGSPQEPGTVVRQDPAPATMVKPGSRVNIWLAAPQPPLAVEIVPPRLEVRQGENAVFVARFFSAARISRQWWIGPDGERHDGDRLRLRTDRIAPGTHELLYHAETEQGQRGEARAVLLVTSRPQPTRLTVAAQPVRVTAGEPVRVAARLDRESEEAEYRFDLGDGTVTPWMRRPQADHVYRSPGRYSLTATARIGRTIVTGSEPVTVTVQPAAPEVTLTLHADRKRAVAGEKIRFGAVASRPVTGARYRFEFGDSTSSEWQPEAETEHSYGREGSYQARVQIRADDGVTQVSAPLAIVVKPSPSTSLTVTLNCEPTRLNTEEQLVCEAGYSPRQDGEVSYDFTFGDGTASDWQNGATVRHRYHEPGEYPLAVRIRVNAVVAGESTAIIVQVAEESPSIRGPVSPPDDEPLQPELLWEAVIALTTVTLAAAIYIWHRRRMRSGRSARVRSFVAIAHQDLGEQAIAAGGDGKAAGNLHFVVAVDQGVQEIDPAYGLVASEDDFTGGERDGT